MREGLGGHEDEPVIELVDGQEVMKYLTPGLKDRFVRTLVIANNGGVFSEEYFRRYMFGFEHRVKRGRVTLLLADGEPAAMGAVDVVGKYPDGRTLYEMRSLVVLPEFEGRGFASQLMEHRFRKIRTDCPDDPIVVTTLQDKIAKKCLKLGMKVQSGLVEMKIRNPKEKFLRLSQEQYDAMMEESVRNMERQGYKNYFFDPLEKPES